MLLESVQTLHDMCGLIIDGVNQHKECVLLTLPRVPLLLQAI